MRKKPEKASLTVSLWLLSQGWTGKGNPKARGQDLGAEPVPAVSLLCPSEPICRVLFAVCQPLPLEDTERLRVS